MFAKFTSCEKKTVFVNPARVAAVTESAGGCAIQFDSGSVVEVAATVDAVVTALSGTSAPAPATKAKK